MTRQHSHVPVVTLVIAALLIGVSIAAGPVVWALIIMLSPLAIFYAIVRSSHRPTH